MRDLTPAELAIPGQRAAVLRLLGFCVLIGLLTYGFELFNVHLSIDNEITGFADLTARVWLTPGRWGTHLLNRFVLSHPVIPVVPMAITIVGFSVSYVLSAITWRWPIDGAHYVAAPFALSFPVLVHLSAFLGLVYAVAIGCCLAALAVYLASRDRPAALLLAILPLTAAISTYQPVALFPVVSFLIFAAMRVPLVGGRRTLRRLIGFSLVLTASLLLYYAIWRAWLWWRDLAPAYVDRFIQVDVLRASPGPTLAASARFAWEILSGQGDLFLEKRYTFAMAVLLAGGVVLLDRWLARRNLGQYVLQILLVGAALVLPLTAVVINAGSLPYRTLLGTPIGLAGLVFVAMSAGRLWGARLALTVLAGVCLLGFVSSANRLLFAHSLVVQADRDLANRLVDRMHAVGAAPEGGPTLVEFVGAHRMLPWPGLPRVSSSTLGASFFEWDEGNPVRMTVFMRSMGYDLRRIGRGQRVALLERIRAMPSWPADGSVQRLDGIIVVKFSDYTERQRQSLGLLE
jgi:hypothetical protein